MMSANIELTADYAKKKSIKKADLNISRSASAKIAYFILLKIKIRHVKS